MKTKILRKYWMLVIGGTMFLIGLVMTLWSSESGAALGILGVVIGAGITTVYQFLDSSTERKHQMAMAALDQRLKAHQEAFALWRKLLAKIQLPDDISEHLEDCQSWWDQHCLYLTSEARSAFRKAVMISERQAVLIQDDRADGTEISKNWDMILDAGDKIIKGVELPSMGKQEAEDIKSGQKNGA